MVGYIIYVSEVVNICVTYLERSECNYLPWSSSYSSPASQHSELVEENLKVDEEQHCAASDFIQENMTKSSQWFSKRTPATFQAMERGTERKHGRRPDYVSMGWH